MELFTFAFFTLALFFILRTRKKQGITDSKSAVTPFALWFGGFGLFFFTAIVPIPIVGWAIFVPLVLLAAFYFKHLPVSSRNGT
ncbi:hypothetical protein [Salisediminibacterium halotolerans]|uniref:Uncharacterized protein n=1 Tax=Salisediminibacterium halotolerans TaxID=517425 RepID=A0A1H9TAQ5_9BACI|nr:MULTISPECIES: hypothetical protein [Salisediminibacterium]RLJ71668.1 hypothetical protein BCL39_2339 [Actinophytocola xinjiangensis]RPE86818.1 hypothetical protein EDD67_1680 [Salisediminibacterium halotolerans]TWG32881.1 hypothetical protein BCL52_2334 [Salisediminibacterium halotolerans]SER93849.1 hypothetical protein SAMN05444126_10950 [Salisediminibacterium haloalkalitolerans]